MTRRFFDQLDDEVRGFVGPTLRGFQSEKSSRLLKLWYDDPAVHFEAQILGTKWAPVDDRPCVEVGLHLEYKARKLNKPVLDRLIAAEDRWAARLPDAEHGDAFGPMRRTWLRLSEVMPIDELDEESAGEAAERFAVYIVTLQPLLSEVILSAKAAAVRTGD